MAGMTLETEGVFIAYAHRDQPIVKKLVNYLHVPKSLMWTHEIDRESPRSDRLLQSRVVLLMISPDFLNSDYCYSSEMAQVIERHRQGKVQVLPVIIRPIYWHGTPFASLQVLPDGAIPITLQASRPLALRKVTQAIQTVLNNYQQLSRAHEEHCQVSSHAANSSRLIQTVNNIHKPKFSIFIGFLSVIAAVIASVFIMALLVLITSGPSALVLTASSPSVREKILMNFDLGNPNTVLKLVVMGIPTIVGTAGLIFWLSREQQHTWKIFGRALLSTLLCVFLISGLLWYALNMNFGLSIISTVLTAVESIIVVTGGLASVFSLLLGPKEYKWKIFRYTLLSTLPVVLVIGSLLWYFLAANAQPMWTTALEEFAPYCDKSSNATWVVFERVKPSTHIECPRGGLLITPLSTTSIAQVSLDRVNGQSYSQTKLDTQIQVTFQNEPDPDTMAGLLIQSQQGLGGYGLWINNTGYWLLEDNSGNMRASSGKATSRTVFKIEMKVQQGKLYGSINDEQVFKYDDTLNPSPGAIALAVYGSNTHLSPVLFSDFRLNL